MIDHNCRGAIHRALGRHKWGPYILAMVAVFFLFSINLYSAELAPEGTRERKFQRGLMNTVFAPFELSKALSEVKDQDKWFATWIPAMIWGSVHMMIRAVTGVYEIVTFPVPSPPEYRPILKPEFALQHLETSHPT